MVTFFIVLLPVGRFLQFGRKTLFPPLASTHPLIRVLVVL